LGKLEYENRRNKMQGIIPRIFFFVFLWATITKTLFGETTTCYRDKEWTICETDDTMREIRAEEAREAREAHYQQMEAYALEAAGRAEVRELREGSYE